MSVSLDPLVSEFESEEQAESYDRWFRAKVREAMESASPKMPHDQAVTKISVLLEEKRPRVLAVRWTDEAVYDLATIVDYIDERNPDAALRLRDDVVSTVEKLGERPFLYRPGRVPGTREALIRPTYLVVYAVGEGVDILRVLHTARQYP